MPASMTGRRRSKVSRALAAGAAVTLLLSACGGGDEGGDGENVTLTYRLWDEQQQKGLEKVFAAFEEEHPDIQVDVELLPYDQYWTKLVTEAASGTGPDLFWMSPAYFPDLVSQGVFMDVGEAIEEAGQELEDYNENVVDSYTYEDKLYAVPKDWGIAGMLYNRKAFEEAGVEMPTEPLTWAPDGSGTFLPLMQKLTIDAEGRHPNEPGFDEDNVQQWGFGSWNHSQTQWLNWIPSNGGSTITEPYGEFSLGEPKSVEALQWGVDLIEKWHVSPPADQTNPPTGAATEMFQRGEIAVFPANNALLPFVAPEAEFPIGTASLPEGPAGRVTVINGLGEAVFSGTDHPEEAMELATYLASAEAQSVMAEDGYVFPALNELAPRYVDYWKGQKIDTQPFLDEAEGETVNFPILRGYTAAEPVVNQIFNDMYLGSIDVQEAADRADEEANALLED